MNRVRPVPQDIPILDKDKEVKIGIKIRKLDTNFSLNENYHRHTYEELIWVQEGEGQQLIDEQLIQIQPNTLYLIANGQVHKFIEGKDLNGVVITFNTTSLKSYPPFHAHLLDQLIRNFKTYNIIPLNEEAAEELNLVIPLILREFEKPPITFGKRDTLTSYLLILLTLIERFARTFKPLHTPSTPDYKRSIYEELKRQIDLHFSTQHNLSFYSKEMGISNRLLTHCSKLYSNKPTKQLLLDRIIIEAQRLLIYTSKTVEEIAASLGFEETAYFIRIFKKKTATTPRQFRIKER